MCPPISNPPDPDNQSSEFYRRSLRLLEEAGVPFLVGGAYAFCVYTGITRQTKDFDLFVRPAQIEAALDVFRRAGYRAEKAFAHWLGKVFGEADCIDIIYRAGNGLCEVEDLWFERAREAEVFGIRAKLCAPEEMIWMKAYIMERERFDGADVAHLLLHRAAELDWEHLLRRFGPDWRVLLSHLVLFGFIYPGARERVPAAIMERLVARLGAEETSPNLERTCRGTLLSRAQYLPDIREGGLGDARLDVRSGMTADDIERWSRAIDDGVKPHSVAGD